MKNSEKINTMMFVPAPMIADALSEFLICKMIPALANDEKKIAMKKQYWEPMIKIFSKCTMEEFILAFQYETQEQLNAVVKKIERKRYPYLALNPPQFQYLTNYLSKNMPDGVVCSEWRKSIE